SFRDKFDKIRIVLPSCFGSPRSIADKQSQKMTFTEMGWNNILTLPFLCGIGAFQKATNLYVFAHATTDCLLRAKYIDDTVINDLEKLTDVITKLSSILYQKNNCSLKFHV
ncbi:hypothetical protein PENTCL1PPCAC_19101, partial [Pristionchus entomophagus]